MKTINYTGSSKLISRIVNLLNRKAPLPLDGGGDPDWGSNGQFLTTDGAGGTTWSSGGGGGDTVTWTQDVTTGTKIASIDINGNSTDVYAPSGGSGGHTIENTSGSDLPQEDNLQFVGVYTEDDSANDRTKVNIVRQMTKAAMQALSSAEKEGFIDTTDEDDDYIPISAEDVKYGNTDVESKLDALTTDVSGKVSKSGDTMTGNLIVDRQDGTASAFGLSYLMLGNNIPYGTDKNSFGALRFYGGSSFYTDLSGVNATGNRTIILPDKDGTFALTSDITSTLLLNYATPFYSPNVQAGHIRFTFTGLGQYESVHLLIFTRRCAGDLLLECSSTGFSSITKGLLVDNGSGYNLGYSYNPNNGYTVKVQVGEWSSAWGIFVHPNFPNATMTMTRES